MVVDASAIEGGTLDRSSGRTPDWSCAGDWGGVAGSATAEDDGDQPADPLDATEAAIADAMVRDFGVSEDVAAEWSIRQERFLEVSGRLADANPAIWGGSEIDHEAGTLIVRATDTAKMAERVEAEPAAEGVQIDIRPAEWSMADLQERATEISSMARSRGEVVLPLLDPAQNRVVVQIDRHASSSLREDIRSRPEVRMDLRDRPPRSQPASAAVPAGGDPPGAYNCFFTVEICDPPLRGGIEIEPDNDIVGQGCTGGFLVRSTIDQKPYLLIAGHCLDGHSGDWMTKFSHKDTADHTIGSAHPGWEVDGWTHDEGLLQVDHPSGWSLPETSHVLIQDWSYGQRTADRDPWYQVTQVGNSGPGLPADSYLCMTGATHDTRCLPHDYNMDSHGFLEVPDGVFGICQGDSGGPVYAYGTGYGILTAIVPSQDHTHSRRRYIDGDVDIGCAHSGEHVAYMSLLIAMDNLNVELHP